MHADEVHRKFGKSPHPIQTAEKAKKEKLREVQADTRQSPFPEIRKRIRLPAPAGKQPSAAGRPVPRFLYSAKKAPAFWGAAGTFQRERESIGYPIHEIKKSAPPYRFSGDPPRSGEGLGVY